MLGVTVVMERCPIGDGVGRCQVGDDAEGVNRVGSPYTSLEPGDWPGMLDHPRLRFLLADDAGSVRYVEVKGRSGKQAIELTANEWAQAANHRDRYWLYVVYDCDTTPTLYRVPDPFGNLLARRTGAVRIAAGDVLAAADLSTAG